MKVKNCWFCRLMAMLFIVVFTELRLGITETAEGKTQHTNHPLVKYEANYKDYKEIDIGDVTLFGGGGGGGAEGEDGAGGAGAFQVFGNVLMPMMIMSKMMGFDFKGTMKEALGEMSTDDEKKKTK